MSKPRRSLGVLLVGGLLFACSPPPPDATDPPRSQRPDPHSFSRPDQVAVRHLDLDLDVDFESETLSGTATWSLDRPSPGSPLILDTRGLRIGDVTTTDGSPLAYRLGPEDPLLGQALEIDLPADVDRVTVEYRTSPEADALLWVDPSQTAGGVAPFLFSQSQAILARTWVPCQDSPGVRFSYAATLRVPEGLQALMSAAWIEDRPGAGRYRFAMEQPISSYLLAVAVGELEYRPLGPRTGVWAEPAIVESAAWEFAATEEMMETIESMYGPYRWERFDILVLPPSFPYGGMENPRLTFATPTLIAGDRSLVSTIAHELAHSWSGNLVTNATWDDFWLNEGFTTYLERRIMEELEGTEYREMLAELGLWDLRDAFAQLGGETSPDTALRLHIGPRDPDRVTTDVAYEKGYLFLRLLEETFGRDRWDPFLLRWFEDNAFGTVSSDDFVVALRTQLLAAEPESGAALEIDAWIDGPGLPENAPVIASDRLARVTRLANDWSSGAIATDTLPADDWSTQEWVQFLRTLPGGLSTTRFDELDTRFDLSDRGNAEILFAWLLLTVDAGYEPARPALEAFLTSVGRRKFLGPLYTHLVADPEGREVAEEIYARARPRYHPLAVSMVDRILAPTPPNG